MPLLRILFRTRECGDQTRNFVLNAEIEALRDGFSHKMYRDNVAAVSGRVHVSVAPCREMYAARLAAPSVEDVWLYRMKSPYPRAPKCTVLEGSENTACSFLSGRVDSSIRSNRIHIKNIFCM